MIYDVAIVGAGAAGISSARALVAAGRSVVVLEASSRVGGRAFTLGFSRVPLDIGCGWLHSAERNPLVAVARQNGFRLIEGRTAWQDQWRDLGFTKNERNAAQQSWMQMISAMEDNPPVSDLASDVVLSNDDWDAYRNSLSGFLNGAPLNQLSVRDFLNYDNFATEANWRVAEGYGTLIAASLPAVETRFSCPVRGVDLRHRDVRLVTDRGVIEARSAIITVSTSILAKGVIDFGKAGDDHLHAASSLPMGLADKVFLKLTGNHGLEPETHLLGNPRQSATGSYYIRPLGRQIIEGFFGGEGAVAIETAGVREAFSYAMEQLASLLGSGIRRHLTPMVASSWSRTDWIEGSYSHARPQQAECRSSLARPLAERIFFAGEATHPSDFSTVHGAWESGLRAAQAVLELLEKMKVQTHGS